MLALHFDAAGDKVTGQGRTGGVVATIEAAERPLQPSWTPREVPYSTLLSLPEEPE